MRHPKPHPLFEIATERLPRRKAVTICGGVLCTDGIVLCADTQETIGGYSKTDTSKIRSFHSNVFTLSMTGSCDDADYLEQAFQEIVQACADVCDPTKGRAPTWNEINGKLQTVCTDFFTTHLLPLAPTPQDRPEISIILAIVVPPNVMCKVIRARGTTFLTSQAYHFTGIGSDVADQLYKKLFTSSLPMQQTAGLAIHILGHVKRTVAYCGGNSDIFLLRYSDGDYLHIPTAEARRLEEVYAAYDFEAHHNLANKIITSAPQDAQLVGFVRPQSTSPPLTSGTSVQEP